MARNYCCEVCEVIFSIIALIFLIWSTFEITSPVIRGKCGGGIVVNVNESLDFNNTFDKFSQNLTNCTM